MQPGFVQHVFDTAGILRAPRLGGGANGSWRYNPRGHFLYEQDEVRGLVGAFPPVDMFLAHNSLRASMIAMTRYTMGSRG